MPAAISFVNGRAEAAFGLKPAWWDGTGQYVLDHYPNSDQMIRAAHLDWQVQTRRLFDDYSFRGQGRSRFENKLASVMFGQGADFKQQAFELALDMAA